MHRNLLIIVLIAVGLAACGGEDTVLEFPQPEGSQADYFPLHSGDIYIYRVNGDPLRTATLRVQSVGNGIDEFELTFSGGNTPRMAVLAHVASAQIDLQRFERAAVRVELDPTLAAIEFPLQQGRSYNSTTRIEFLGGRLGVDLMGVSNDFGETTVLRRTYAHTFSVSITTQVDLLGQTRVEMELAQGIGPVSARLLSPAIENLGLEGLELRLELLEAQGRNLP